MTEKPFAGHDELRMTCHMAAYDALDTNDKARIMELVKTIEKRDIRDMGRGEALEVLAAVGMLLEQRLP